jgi:hypothetical protein
VPFEDTLFDVDFDRWVWFFQNINTFAWWG